MACNQSSKLKFERVSTGDTISPLNIADINLFGIKDTSIAYRYAADGKDSWFLIDNDNGNLQFIKSNKLEDTIKGMLNTGIVGDYVYQTKVIAIRN
ncbi:MAG: hypothetical protein WCO35_01585 [Candidatus Nomurabacteria bacterium]